MGVKAELVTEFAKDLVWENNMCALANQIYVFGNQYYRMKRVSGVEVLVVDSPLLLTSVYDSEQYGRMHELLRDLAYEAYCTFDNMDYFIKREDEVFEEWGRVHTSDSSLILDSCIRGVLSLHNVKICDISRDSAELIVREVIDKLYGGKKAC